jgi:hypothetical protein
MSSSAVEGALTGSLTNEWEATLTRGCWCGTHAKSGISARASRQASAENTDDMLQNGALLRVCEDSTEVCDWSEVTTGHKRQVACRRVVSRAGHGARAPSPG